MPVPDGEREFDGLDDADEFGTGDKPAPPGETRDPREVLRAQRQRPPRWLLDLREGRPLDRDLLDRVLSTRAVFYPGAGHDGQPFDVFGVAGAAHCFINADYEGPEVYPPGYDTVVHQQFDWAAAAAVFGFESAHPLGLPDDAVRFSRVVWAVLARGPGVPPAAGPERVAVLTVGGEAFWAYWNLWGRGTRGRPPFGCRGPYAVLLEDHGFGGNMTSHTFGGAESPLLDWGRRESALPEWLLVGENTAEWPGYAAASGWAGGAGMHQRRRRLLRRSR